MKKIYIQENKLNLLNEGNSPDNIEYLGTKLSYLDNDAYPFIVIKTENGLDVKIYPENSTTHMFLKRDMAAKKIGFKSYEYFIRYVRENIEEKDDWMDELNGIIDDIELNIEYEGRYWCNNELLIFWYDTPPTDIIDLILLELSEFLKININNPKIVIGDYVIPYEEYNYWEKINNNDFRIDTSKTDKELKNIHLMNQQDKREALTDFRQNRAEVQGKKLGKMPMAQYHSLIYQEEKDVFNWGSYFSNLKRIDESINKYLLTESQESKSISAAKKLLMQRLGYDEQQADEFVRVKLRNDLPVLRTPEGGKFILGVTRMYIDGELNDANIIGNLNSTLKLVASDAHINEYDRNLNNISANDLINRFAKAISDNLNAEKEEINQMVFDTPSDYEIVKIDSFEQASEYGKYTSWCVTHNRNMFNSYTSEGMNQFYFCLKNDFEYIKPNKGENCPLDEYGLSMIAVSVDEKGMLNTCTCRWNHDNGGNDSIMNTKEISQVVGVNFFDVFKPSNMWEDLVTNAINRLKNGENPRNIFDDYEEQKNNFILISLNGKFNYIKPNNELLSPNQWYDVCYDFVNGFAIVELKRKCNFINEEGKILFPDQWFGGCGNFVDGIARVKSNGRWNYINTNGELLSPNQWFDECKTFSNGFSIVCIDWKYNYINTNGEILFPNQWLDGCGDFDDDGICAVLLNNKISWLKDTGEMLYPNQWFDCYFDESSNTGEVNINGKQYYLNNEGQIIGEVNENTNKQKKIYINELQMNLLTES